MRLISLLVTCVLALAATGAHAQASTRNQKAFAAYGTGLNLAFGGAYTQGYFDDKVNETTTNFETAGSPWFRLKRQTLERDYGGPILWGLPEQLAWLRERNAEVPFANDTMYVVWIGGNDYFGSGTFNFAVSRILADVRETLLIDLNATTVLIAEMPDISSTPLFQGAVAVGDQTIPNQNLRAGVAQLQADFPTRNIIVIDNDAMNQRIRAKPQFAGVTFRDKCKSKDQDDWVLENKPAFTICNNSDSYLFWDAVHPTRAVHKLTADELYINITTPSAWNISSVPSQWVVLGDSLSDPGQLANLTSSLLTPDAREPLPYTAHYPLNRFTNERVWAEYLGDRLARPLKPVAEAILARRKAWPGKPLQNTPTNTDKLQTLATKMYGTGVNFAFGGATLATLPGGTHNVVPSRPEVAAVLPSLQTLLGGIYPFWGIEEEFAEANLRFEHTRPAADAMYVLWAGGNDKGVFFTDNSTGTPVRVYPFPYQVSVASVVSRALYMIERWNAKTVVLVTFIGTDADTVTANLKLADEVAKLNRNHPNNDVYLFDTFSIIANMSGINSTSYGIVNTTNQCQVQLEANPVTLAFRYSICSPITTYLKWDDLHPTSVVHKEWARQFVSFMNTSGVAIPSQWFVFGDSLSDNGQLKYWGGAVGIPFPPTAGYPLNRYTDEYSWTEYVGFAWARNQTSIAQHVVQTLQAVKRHRAGVNLAIGGARAVPTPPTGNGERAVDTPAFTAAGFTNTLWDLPRQIQAVRDLHNAVPVARNALHFIWIGGNDLTLLAEQSTVNTTAAETGARLAGIATTVRIAVERLVNELDARRILIGLLPDLSIIPLAKLLATQKKQAVEKAANVTSTTPESQAAYVKALSDVQQASFGLNGLLLKLVQQAINDVYGSVVEVFDAAALVTDVLKNPLANGNNFTNLVDSCVQDYTGLGIVPQPPTTVCSNPDNYIFWDRRHPTTRAHQIFAKAAATIAQQRWTFKQNEPVQYFTYGDSLVDAGNNDLIARSINSKYPTESYYTAKGQWSNGPVTSVYLGRVLTNGSVFADVPESRQTLVHVPFAARSWQGGVNYGIAGSLSAILTVPGPDGLPARTAEKLLPKSLTDLYAIRGANNIPYTLKQQLADAQKRADNIPFSTDALYVIWTGTQEWLSGAVTSTANATALALGVVDAMRGIRLLGGRKFVIGLIPDVSTSLAVQSQGSFVAGNFSIASRTFNDQFRLGVLQYAGSEFGDISIAFIRPNDVLNASNAATLASKYGVTAATTYADTLHYTTQVQAALADDVLAQISAPAQANPAAGRPPGFDVQNIKQVYSFGDAYIDGGNMFLIGQALTPAINFPPPPYPLGHFSNGAVFAEQLSARLGVNQTLLAKLLISEMKFPPVVVIPTSAPTPATPNTTAPTDAPLADGKAYAYELPAQLPKTAVGNGDDITVVCARLAARLADVLGTSYGNVFLVIDAVTLRGKLYFRRDAAKPTDAFTFAKSFADPATRAGYVKSDPILNQIIIEQNTVTPVQVALEQCGDGGYRVTGSTRCSTDSVPAPATQSTSSGVNTGLVVGLVVGIGGGIIALVIFWFALSCCLKKQEGGGGYGGKGEQEMTAV